MQGEWHEFILSCVLQPPFYEDFVRVSVFIKGKAVFTHIPLTCAQQSSPCHCHISASLNNFSCSDCACFLPFVHESLNTNIYPPNSELSDIAVRY